MLIDIDPISPNSHSMFSCLFENMDPLFNIFKNVFMFFERYWFLIQYFQEILRRLFMIFRCPSFPKFKNVRFPKNEICRTNIFKQVLGIFLDFERYPEVSKDKSYWFLGSGTRPKIMKSWKWRLFDFSISKSKSY